MSVFDDEDGPDNLGSIGEQDAAPIDPPRAAAADLPIAGVPPAAPMAGVPRGQIVTRAVTQSPAELAGLADIDANTAARRDTAEAQGNLATDRLTDQAAQLQAEADLKVQQQQELAALKAEQQKHIDDRHRIDEAEYQKYRSMGLKDPDADASIGHRFGAALAIGLGQYSAAMNHTSNKAAEMFAQARADNMALQRDAIERQKEASIKAGKDVEVAKHEAAEQLHQLQVKNVAQIDAFKTRFQAESARMGIPKARIDATATMQDIERQALEARQKHLESTRTLSRDPTPRELRGGKGAGGGKGGDEAKLYDYLTEHPGDFGGVSRLAASLKIDPKRVDKVISANKGTESQTKDAKQSAIGLRAVDAIEKSGYTPSKDDIQAWLNNQRSVGIATKMGESGGLGAIGAGLGQKVGLLKQSETEGLSPKAQEYFANVRRFMETIGRAQSGAAISPTEWQNFFNQYGPNSKGGLAAARTYLEDQARVAGVPGRQLDAGGTVPKASGAPKGEGKPASDAERAKEILARPGAADLSPEKRAYLLKLARGAP